MHVAHIHIFSLYMSHIQHPYDVDENWSDSEFMTEQMTVQKWKPLVVFLAYDEYIANE